MTTRPPPSTSLAITRRHRWRWTEFLPWAIAVAAIFVFPGYLALGTQILVMVLFTLSLDLILGYAGIVTLGHAAFFGIGAYTVGLMSVRLGWTEPLSLLAAAGAVTGLAGLAFGRFLLRYHGLTLLMLTLALSMLLYEAANSAADFTGGRDGITGIVIAPIFGRFENDLFARNYYVYVLIVLFLCTWLARRIVFSPFGLSLIGIRENQKRMHAIGSDVHRSLIIIYAIAAVMAGIAGALYAQFNAYLTVNVLSFERSGIVLIMLILGGTGRLYGAFVGVPVYMLLEDELAKLSPEFWGMGIGFGIVAVVLFSRGGISGGVQQITAWFRTRRAGS